MIFSSFFNCKCLFPLRGSYKLPTLSRCILGCLVTIESICDRSSHLYLGAAVYLTHQLYLDCQGLRENCGNNILRKEALEVDASTFRRNHGSQPAVQQSEWGGTLPGSWICQKSGYMHQGEGENSKRKRGATSRLGAVSSTNQKTAVR